MPRRRTPLLFLAALVPLALVASACGGDDQAGAGAASTVPTSSPAPEPAPSTTPTTLPPLDVGRLPARPDVAYLQRVIDALDKSHGALYRQYKADGGPTTDNMAWLEELYSEPELSRTRSVLGEEAADDFNGTFDVPGDPETIVREIVRQTQSCVLLATRRSLDTVYEGAPANETPEAAEDRMRTFVALQPRSTSDERTDRNPTAWTMIVDGRTVDGTPPADICA